MARRIELLIDTDPGIDDAVALALAAGLPTLDVVAITTVHGNVDVERATRNAREVAGRVGLRAPVIAGAAAPLDRAPCPARETHGPEGLGHVRPSAPPALEPEGAADAMRAAALSHPSLTLCCLGPLTNLAKAVRADPELRARLGPVYVMGGALAVRGTQTLRSEFNWWADPESVRTVLAAGLDVRLVPLDVTRRIVVPGAVIRALAAAGEADGDARFWGDALRFCADLRRERDQVDGCAVHDALAVALVADPDLATWSPARVSVSLEEGEHRGALREEASTGAPVRVATEVRARDVIQLLERTVFGRWLPPGAPGDGTAAAQDRR